MEAEKLCTGNKLEDGKPCKGVRASYSNKYCVHHIDVMEVLFENWIPILLEEFDYFAGDCDIADTIFEDLSLYVSQIVNCFMGIYKDTEVWMYPYSGAYLKDQFKKSTPCVDKQLGDGSDCKKDQKESLKEESAPCVARQLGDGSDCGKDRKELPKEESAPCVGRRLGDGSNCENKRMGKGSYDAQLCIRCYKLERILHYGYGILKHVSPVELELEFSVVKDNNVSTEIRRTGTLEYVEYCVRRDYESMFRKLSDTSVGHRTRFRLYLAPYIFNYPYEERNLVDVDPEFILRYAQTYREALELTGNYSRMYFEKRNMIHPDDIVQDEIEDEDEGVDTDHCDGESDESYNYNTEDESSDSENEGGECEDSTNYAVYDRYGNEENLLLPSTSAIRFETWEDIEKNDCKCCNVRYECNYGRKKSVALWTEEMWDAFDKMTM